ncbi:TPA: hypothetical protein ACSCYS_003413 [Aeromonas veronii]
MTVLRYSKENDVISAINFFQLNNKKVDIATLKGCYRALSKIHHPDLGGSHENMVLLNKYYELLASKIKNGAGFIIDSVSSKEERDAASALKNEMIKRYAYETFESEFDVEKYLAHFEKFFGERFEYNISVSSFGAGKVFVNIKFNDPSMDNSFRIDTSFTVEEDNTIKIGGNQVNPASYESFKGIGNIMMSTSVLLNGKTTKMTRDRYQHVDAQEVFKNPDLTFPTKKLKAGFSKVLVDKYAKADYLNTLSSKFSLHDLGSGDYKLSLGKVDILMHRLTMTFGRQRVKGYMMLKATLSAKNEHGNSVVTERLKLSGTINESENRNEFKIMMKGFEDINKCLDAVNFKFENIQKYIDRIVKMQKIAAFMSKSLPCNEQSSPDNIDFLKHFDLNCITENDAIRHKSREKMIYMKVVDFLNLAKHIDEPKGPTYYSPGEDVKLIKLLDNILSGDKLKSIPSLSVNTSDSVATVIDHDGRHRAMILAALGCDYMPVMLQTSSIRFSQQLDKESMDYRPEWPDMIASEDGDYISDFPVDRESCEVTMMESFSKVLSSVNKGRVFDFSDISKINKLQLATLKKDNENSMELGI